jgi:hypothetical protein
MQPDFAKRGVLYSPSVAFRVGFSIILKSGFTFSPY